MAAVAAIAVVGLGAAAASGAGSGLVKFPKHAVAVGYDPVSIAVGDFNRDGRQDLAVSNFASSPAPGSQKSISILAGRKGGFKRVKTILTPTQTAGIAAGRFGPGKEIDLAVAGYANGQLLLYRGGKGFGFSAPLTTPVGADLRDVVLGDFNGDKRRDVALTRQDTSSIEILIARPGGVTFEAPRSIPNASNGVGMVGARLNGDKRTDLVASDQDTGRIVEVLPTASGFHLVRYKAAGVSGLATADFDRDGHADVAALATPPAAPAHRGGPLGRSKALIFEGSPSGKLRRAHAIALKHPGSLRTLTITAARLNGDKDFDLALGSARGGQTKRGGGETRGEVDVLKGGRGTRFSALHSFSTNGYPTASASVRRGKRRVITFTMERFGNRGAVRVLSRR